MEGQIEEGINSWIHFSLHQDAYLRVEFRLGEKLSGHKPEATVQ